MAFILPLFYINIFVAYNSTTPGIPNRPIVPMLSRFTPTIVLDATPFTIDKKAIPQIDLINNCIIKPTCFLKANTKNKIIQIPIKT